MYDPELTNEILHHIVKKWHNGQFTYVASWCLFHITYWYLPGCFYWVIFGEQKEKTYRVIRLLVFFLNNVKERKIEKKKYVVMSLFFDEGCLMTWKPKFFIMSSHSANTEKIKIIHDSRYCFALLCEKCRKKHIMLTITNDGTVKGGCEDESLKAHCDRSFDLA
jgi:hypothetical protein